MRCLGLGKEPGSLRPQEGMLLGRGKHSDAQPWAGQGRQPGKASQSSSFGVDTR